MNGRIWEPVFAKVSWFKPVAAPRSGTRTNFVLTAPRFMHCHQSPCMMLVWLSNEDVIMVPLHVRFHVPLESMHDHFQMHPFLFSFCFKLSFGAYLSTPPTSNQHRLQPASLCHTCLHRFTMIYTDLHRFTSIYHLFSSSPRFVILHCGERSRWHN